MLIAQDPSHIWRKRTRHLFGKKPDKPVNPKCLPCILYRISISKSMSPDKRPFFINLAQRRERTPRAQSGANRYKTMSKHNPMHIHERYLSIIWISISWHDDEKSQ